MILAVLALAARPQAEPTPTMDYCQVLVVSLRHRRDDFPKSVGTWEQANATFLKRGYDLFRAKVKVLAVDRAIYARLPEVVQAQCLDFFASRGFQPTKVSELPDGIRDAAVNRIQENLPDQTRESALAQSIEASASTLYAIKPPPGMGRNSVRDWAPPPEALASLKAPWPKRDYPTLDPKTPAAEFRIFKPGRGVEADLLAMWDELRPLMKESEKAQSREAKDWMAAINAEAGRWAESQFGIKRGEDALYGSLSPERKALLQRVTSKSDDELQGTKLQLMGGSLRLEFSTGPNGTSSVPLNGLGA